MRILIVESDRKIIKELMPTLKESYITDVAEDSYTALSLSESNAYDVILIDNDGIDIKGLELCTMLREVEVNSPVALLLDRGKDCNRVAGLNSGADVVIYKPLVVEEIIAQINVLVRRNGSTKNCSSVIRVGNVCLNMKDRTVCVGTTPILLRRKEFDLLEYLFINKDKIVSKEELLEHVWEKGMFIFSNTVEVHVRSIRLKFSEEADSRIIRTFRGFGYKIET